MQTILFSGSVDRQGTAKGLQRYKPAFEVQIVDFNSRKIGAVQERKQLDYLVGGELRALSQYSKLKNVVHCLKPSDKPTNVRIAKVGDSSSYDVKNYFHIVSDSASQQNEPGYYDVLVTECLDTDCMDAIRATQVRFVVYWLGTGDEILESIEDDVAYLGIPEDAYVLLDCSKPLFSATSYFKAIKHSSISRRSTSLFNHIQAAGMPHGLQCVGMGANAAGFQLFDPKVLKKKIREYGKDNLNESLKDLQKNIPSGRVSTCPVPEDFNVIFNDLLLKYPNFKQVVDYLRSQLAVEEIGSNPILNFGTPILLDGPPGVGKSAFLMALSERLGTYFFNIACASASNGFDIKGLTSGYSGGKVGHVCNALTTGKVSNPIILLDEVEKGKVSSNTGSSVHSVLYELLEQANAKLFKDEYLDLAIDASQIIWFATCNDVDELPDPIKDRFSIISVQAPTAKELRGIVKNMYSDYVEKKGFKEGKVSSDLDEQVVYLLTTHYQSIREMKTALRKGLGCAVQRTLPEKQVVLQVCDLNQLEQTYAAGIGFVFQ